jgi:hypothetical protein
MVSGVLLGGWVGGHGIVIHAVYKRRFRFLETVCTQRSLFGNKTVEKTGKSLSPWELTQFLSETLPRVNERIV